MPLIHLACHHIGRRYPHTALIGIVSEYQCHAHHFEQQEEEPVAVFCKKIK